MKYIYELTAFNFKHQYRIENRVFTSKKIADASLKNLIDYLVINNNLDSKEISLIKYSKDIERYTVDSLFNVSLIRLEVIKKICIYD